MPTKTPALQTDLAFLLKELIQMRTVTSDQEANRRALQWVKWQLGTLPVHITDFEHSGYSSLMVTTRSTKRPRLLLLAHMDVVPGSDNVFMPREQDGRLYGRGSFDMKFAIAAFVKLFLELGDQLPQYDLGIMLTTDEEGGGFDGAKAMIQRGYGGDIVFNPDGAADWAIEAEAKSHHTLLIESFGVSAHGSRPWEGVNAVNQLMDFLRDFQAEFPAEPCGDRQHRHDTCIVGTITGGEVYNQIPHYAAAEVNIRTMPDSPRADLDAVVKKVMAKHKNLTFKHPIHDSAIRHRTDHPAFAAYAQVVKDKIDRPPEFILSHGMSDARFFTLDNAAVIISKPVGGPQHSENEWIDLASLRQYYDVMRTFVERTARA
jgi:succinyl-diaminopimelate desuccinylase